MRIFQSLLPVLALILISCEPNENFPKAATGVGSSTSTTLANTSVTLDPTNWRFGVGDVGSQGNPNNYRQMLTTGAAGTSPFPPFGNSGLEPLGAKPTSYTLGMATSALQDTASYCYWAYGLYPPTNLGIGKSLTLKARVKLQQVQGKGVSLVLRGDQGAQTSVLFATTEGQASIKGTADFTEYSVTLPYSRSVDRLAVYVVMLANTTGSVLVSDVSLLIN